GSRPDRQRAKKWDIERSSRQLHLHQSTLLDGVVHGNINNGGNGNFILNTREPDNEIFRISPPRVVASPLQHGSNSQERPQTSDPSDVSISPGIEVETDAYNSENDETSDLDTPDHE
ncbi:5014_t:CDS:2, partial [Funneliformis caledonium]